ncbi:hypothetical protein PHMEG_00017361 [Phytophthora megakarya]|uniref:Uncharacterized protein n=1 Tax=Phytophthora megakarya TaxID=4795 RepID=A0A225VXJ6_9STRA|nr:hypothetical protein PHMEG_00017361 [Phytophthora megakarya]
MQELGSKSLHFTENFTVSIRGLCVGISVSVVLVIEALMVGSNVLSSPNLRKPSKTQILSSSEKSKKLYFRTVPTFQMVRVPDTGWLDTECDWKYFVALPTLEVCSFVVLNLLLQREFAFSPLYMYQFAYVLQTQFDLVQMKLLFTALCVLPYNLQHLGKKSIVSLMDFSLRFDWLQSKP